MIFKNVWEPWYMVNICKQILSGQHLSNTKTHVDQFVNVMLSWRLNYWLQYVWLQKKVVEGGSYYLKFVLYNLIHIDLCYIKPTSFLINIKWWFFKGLAYIWAYALNVYIREVCFCKYFYYYYVKQVCRLVCKYMGWEWRNRNKWRRKFVQLPPAIYDPTRGKYYWVFSVITSQYISAISVHEGDTVKLISKCFQ